MPTLAICQLFNPVLHGEGKEADGHYLALHTCDEALDETPADFLDFWSPSTFTERLSLNEQMTNVCRKMINRLRDTDEVDTYDNSHVSNIRELQRFPKVDIVDTIILDSGHMVAIKKTVWLSIFQRMLKKRYSNKSNIEPMRKKARKH